MPRRKVSAVLLLYLLIPAAIVLTLRFAPLIVASDTPYALDADSYDRAWIDFSDLEDPWATPPRYTDDPAVIADIVSYLNTLALRERTELDVASVGGNRTRIELIDRDTGATNGFGMAGNTLIAQDGGETYVMRFYLDALSLERDVFPRMREASTMRGTVVATSEEGDRTTLTFQPDVADAVIGATGWTDGADAPDAPYVPGTIGVTLPTKSIYRNDTPGAYLVVGEPIICFLDDWSLGDSLTLSEIWRVVALSPEPPVLPLRSLDMPERSYR